MADQRRVGRVGNSWRVAVPRSVREHLGLLHGGDVYWHLGPKGEAYFTVGPRRVGGKPPGLDLAPQLEGARREIERLRARVQARPEALAHQEANAIYMQAIGVAFKQLPWVGELFERLDRIEAWMPQRARWTRRRVRSRARPVVSAGSGDAPSSPSSSSSSVPIDGGAEASGAEPPGLPP